ncbi:hypothetical protein [Marinomonas vulgaris]|uniref:hypothetical protein n=1 Tax=Marinomonas vulgaris TaxID=2823372 RepID=UPI002E28D1C2|nr:hypothetical protein [Marinomonas vulgaris]
MICLLSSSLALAECRDDDAKFSADKKARSFMSGDTFMAAKVLKRHLPSRRKEVASYIYVKADDLYYTVYTLVNSACKADVIKRTKGKH